MRIGMRCKPPQRERLHNLRRFSHCEQLSDSLSRDGAEEDAEAVVPHSKGEIVPAGRGPYDGIVIGRFGAQTGPGTHECALRESWHKCDGRIKKGKDATLTT